MSLLEMFNSDSIEKQLNIKIGNATYTNVELCGEEMELAERLCSEETLRFGCCEASTFQIRILNTVLPLKGKTIEVSMDLIGEETERFPYGKYKVDSDKPTADRRYRDIVAYDAMYDIINADVAEWYNAFLPNKDSAVTLKEFRTHFLAHFGIEQEEITLVNDTMIIAKTVEPTTLSGKKVITAICEINGCFGHIGRDGKFQYIHLKEMKEGLYPSNTLYPRDDLYPADPLNVQRIRAGHYISATYEDFKTERINKLQIRQEEDDIGYIYGEGDNCYIVQDNFLVYGKSSGELNRIASNLYSVICKVWYRPAHVEAKGNPCLEVGDGICLSTRYEVIYTYILQRTLKGIQALRDTYDAEGEQYQKEDVNSVHESIIQLKGKTNVLKRTLEETRSEITDMENGLSSRITQTAEQISLEVTRAKGVEETLSSKITQTAEKITLEVTRAKGVEETLSSKITQTAEQISLEVTRAKGVEETLSSRITQTAEQISLKVSRGSIISEINQTAEQITIKANRIDLNGLVNADQFVAKFATIETLNATKATIQELETNKASVTALNALNAVVNNLKVDKLDASDFTAAKISALDITVKAANITGKLSADNIDVDTLFSRFSANTVMNVGLISTSTLRVGIYEFLPEYNSTLGCYILKGRKYGS